MCGTCWSPWWRLVLNGNLLLPVDVFTRKGFCVTDLFIPLSSSISTSLISVSTVCVFCFVYLLSHSFCYNNLLHTHTHTHILNIAKVFHCYSYVMNVYTFYPYFSQLLCFQFQTLSLLSTKICCMILIVSYFLFAAGDMKKYWTS
jgi:hypothetical protein